MHSREIYSVNRTAGDREIEESNKDSNTFRIPGLIAVHFLIDNYISTPGLFILKDVSRGTNLFIYDPQEVVI